MRRPVRDPENKERPDVEATKVSGSPSAPGGDETIPVGDGSGSHSAATIGVDGGEARSREGYLGRYRLVEELGRGGQATVYLAVDEQLGREVALKVLSVGGQGPAALKRFQREAAIVSRLDDPGICAVHDAGVIDGCAYIAMQYLRGASFGAWLQAVWGDSDPGESSSQSRSGKPSRSGGSTRHRIDRVLEAVEKVARSLHVAHEAGVIHRDIKSANIMMTEGDRPVVVDFGLARASDLQQESLTQAGDLFGTPLYMSPEQVRGEPLDARSDVYSLGVVLYEALTGRRPHLAPTREALYRAILTESATHVRSLRPELSSDLQVIVETAMEKDRKRRYQSAEALADDIGRARRHEIIRAKPVPAWFRFWRLCQRNPLASSLTALIFVLLTVGLVFTMSQNRELERRREASERAAYRARIAAAHAAFRSGDAATLRQALSRVEPVRRGWEWRYLSARLSEPVARIPTGFDVMSLRPVANDDRFVWIGSRTDRLLRLDAEKGEIDRTLQIAEPCRDLQPSPDGRSLLLWLPRQGGLMLVDAQTAAPLWSEVVPGVLEPPGAFSPNGREVLVPSPPARVISAATGEVIRRLPALDASDPSNVHFVTDDLLVARYDKNPRAAARFRVHDAQDGRILRELDGLGELIRVLSIDQKRGRVIINGTSASPEIAARGLPQIGSVTTVLDIREDRRLLDRIALPGVPCFVGGNSVACLAPGGIEVRDLRSGAVESRIHHEMHSNTWLESACGGQRLVLGLVGGEVIVWDTWQIRSPWTAAANVGWHTTLSPRGDLYAWSNWSIVHVSDARDGRLLWEYNFPIRDLVAFRFSDDSRFLGVGDNFGALYAFDARTGALLSQSGQRRDADDPRRKKGKLIALAWLPDGETMVAADVSGRIVRWRKGDESFRDLVRLDRRITALSPTASGAELLVALGPPLDGSTTDGGAALVDLSSGETRSRVTHPTPVTAIAEALDLADGGASGGRFILTGDDEGRIQLREPDSLETRRETLALGATIYSLDWASGIDRLLVGSESGLSVIDLADDAEVLNVAMTGVSTVHHVPERDAIAFAARMPGAAFGALETRRDLGLDARRHLQARVTNIVRSLLDEAPLVVDAKAALPRLDLDPEIRREVEATLDRTREAAAWLNSDGWSRGLNPRLAPEVYAAALRTSRRACELAPTSWSFINTRNQLLYRCELYEECLASIDEGVALYQSRGRTDIHSHDRLIRAMALARLGRAEEARREFLQSLADWNRKDDTGVYREALALIPLPSEDLPPPLR
ncbi:MAG: protein kinase [Planctomycetota bacterium]